MIKKHNIEQRSEEWFKLRLEHPMTASNAKVISVGGVGLKRFIERKFSERFFGTIPKQISNDDMDRGVELEPCAREFYSLEKGYEVEEVGFITNSKYEYTGISPDGVIESENGGCEIKCQNDIKHLISINNIQIENQYMWQMQMQMLICEWDFNDFTLYNPNFKDSLLIENVKPDLIKQQKLIVGLEKGRKYYQELINKYKKVCKS